MAAGIARSVLALAAPGARLPPPALTKAQQDDLRRNFALCLAKLKGPYTENYCVCPNGQKLPVQVNERGPKSRAANAVFCSAYRAPWAEALGRQRMWIANLFARDLYQWDSFTDHHDLVRGYILEKYFTETNPTHKLAEMRSYGGLAGAEYEAAAAPRFFERYLDAGRLRRRAPLPPRLRAPAPLLRARRPGADPEDPQPRHPHPAGRPALQAAARRDPQPAVRRAHPEAAGVPRQGCRPAPCAGRSTS